MRRGPTLLLIALLLLTTYPQPEQDNLSAGADYFVTSSQPSLSLDVETGEIFSSSFNINGSIWDDELPEQLFWQLESAGAIVAQDSAMLSLQENFSWAEANTRSWSFSAEINTTDLDSCSCRLTVIVIDTDQQVSDDSALIFLQLDNSTLPPAISIESPDSGVSWRGDILITGKATSILGNQPLVKWGALKSNLANHFCTRGALDSYIEVEEWNTDSVSYAGDSIFEIDIDVSSLEDGWWIITAMTTDSQDESSHPACVAVALHNQKPVAQISGTTHVVEGEFAHFDASNSDDPVWGKDGLMFTFMVRQNESTAPPLVFDQGVNMSLTWLANRSGVFFVKVIVTDTSGLSNYSEITMEVENVGPVAHALIDGISFESDEIVRLPDEQFWNVDASGSSDSVNDRGGLSFVWFVDGEPVSLGETQILRREWLKDESKAHLITLSVTDDDGSSDFVQVIVGIQNTESDPLYSEPLSVSQKFVVFFGGEVNTMVVFMAVMLLVSGLTLKLTKGDRENEIPKWIPSRSRKNSRNETEEVEDDFDDDY